MAKLFFKKQDTMDTNKKHLMPPSGNQNKIMEIQTKTMTWVQLNFPLPQHDGMDSHISRVNAPNQF